MDNVSRLCALAGTISLVLGTLTVGTEVSAAAARARPDLVVTSGSSTPRTVAVGERLRVRHVVRNAGPARSARSVSQFDLVAGSRTVRLGVSAVPALARRASRAATVTAVVPALAPGSYGVRVCADARRTVAERSEKNNCRVIGSVVVAPRPTDTPATTPSPVPVPVPPTSGSDGTTGGGTTPPPVAVPGLPVMDPGDTTLDGFSATTPRLGPASVVVQQMAAACTRVHPVRPVSLAEALANIQDRLRRDAPDGVRLLRASPAYADPVALQQLAATGVLEGTPGLALAALVRVAELEPTVATHLVNAAALAVSLGLPNEAIALLDASEGRTSRAPALGVPIAAVSATVRAQALVMTGRLEQARRWFTAVRASTPMLTEADTGLATVEVCAGGTGSTERAERLVQRSRVRTHERSTPDQVPVEIDPATRVDLTAGRATDLRVLPLAQSPSQAIAMHRTYSDVVTVLADETRASDAALDAALSRLDQVDAGSSLAERTRRASLMDLGQRLTTSDSERLEAQVERERGELDTLWDEFWADGFDSTFGTIVKDSEAACAGAGGDCELRYVNDHCRPALATSHRHWVVAMGRLQAAAAERLRDLSLARSSVASNLAEPAANRVVLLHIAQLERELYAMLAGEAVRWATSAASFQTFCVAPLPADVLAAPAAPEAATAGPCPPDLSRISYKAGWDDLYEMKINCEKVSGEVAVEVLPLLFAFAELSCDYRAGTVTLMGGSKTKIGGGPIEGSFKSGVYITVDGATGSIKDVGWQVGPEVTASKAGVELSVYKDEMDFSFVSGLTGG